ncbi:MAG: signal peptidase I [Proteobacteria bacterium]|nr:signal peptidase I [Pseudomonadota bacterium]MBU1686175.1 signal peptidase I [Pseudomonadota bacterium]
MGKGSGSTQDHTNLLYETNTGAPNVTETIDLAEPTESTSPSQTTTKKKSKLRELVESIAWALILALFIRTCVVQAFKIPSGSMEDTLLVGDHLLVNKFLYGIKLPFTNKRLLKVRDPQRGDVIVFEFPKAPATDFIKRVIGVPGDEIAVRDKQVYVNGALYHNPHEIHKESDSQSGKQSPRDNFGPVRVPAHSYFVMGDNRDRSYDSRFWGFVKDSAVEGKAFIKYWSWNSDDWRVRWSRIGKLIE